MIEKKMNFFIKQTKKIMNKLPKNKKEEIAIQMWHGSLPKNNMPIIKVAGEMGLGPQWDLILNQAKDFLKSYKKQKVSNKELKKFKRKFLKTVYPKKSKVQEQEKVNEFRVKVESVIDSVENEYWGCVDLLEDIVNDIEDSKLKAYDEHMAFWLEE